LSNNQFPSFQELQSTIVADRAERSGFFIISTLLAQVDSSVGGKTGVNLASGKNLVGAFYQPKMVFINHNTLATLPESECRAGYAEVIKYGIINDAKLFAELEGETKNIFNALAAGTPEKASALPEIIKRCCEIKAEVVAQDERENGIRAILNYGHTFAHAIEMLTNYKQFVHGEAVAIGMHAAAVLANKLGMCDSELINRQKMLIEAAIFVPLCLISISCQALLSASTFAEPNCFRFPFFTT